MLKPLLRTGYRFFGDFIHRRRSQLQGFARQLKVARLPYSVEEYFAGMIFASLLVMFLGGATATFVLTVFYGDPLPVAIGLGAVIGVSLAGLTVFLFLWYPSYVANERRSDIEGRLAYAVTHMSTLAGTGIPPVAIFKALVNFKEYGEISKECAYIVRDVDVFGKDLYTAISDAARASPSRQWADVLWGVVSTLRSGGDLRAFLSEKARQLVELQEREERKAMENLGVLTEVFMVGFVLAPIIGVLMIVFMGLFGGAIFGLPPRLLLLFIVYFGVPILGLVFLAVANSSRPKEVL